MTTKTFDIFDFENKSKITIEAKKNGKEWIGICPKHDDQKASLAINEEKGKFHCFGCGFKGSLYDLSKEPNNDKKKIVAIYDYQDQDGKLLHQVVRYDPKDFRQRRPDGNGGWIWNLEGIQPTLYRLPELLKSEEVIVVEGEKDADNLNSHGFCATTCSMGAGKWKGHYNGFLKEKDVILCPDNDQEGREHMTQVGISLNGTSRSLKWLELQDLPSKGDISDWLAKFKDKAEATERFAIMIENAEPWKPSPDMDSKQPVRFCEVAFPPREPIIRGFPLYKKLLYLQSGEGGGLKSFVAFALIKSILSKMPLFGKYEVLVNGPVLLFDEETPEPVMEERLSGFGLKNKDFDGYLFHFSGLRVDQRDDLKQILSMVERYHPVLCVFDSLTRFHNAEENSNTEMKQVMKCFRKVTNIGPMGWLIHHVSKESKLSRGAVEIPNAVDLEFISSVDNDGLLTLKTKKDRIERPEPIILKPVFGMNMRMEYQMTQGSQLWEQIHTILLINGIPLTINEIIEKLDNQGIRNVSDKVVRTILDNKAMANLVKKEKLPLEVIGKGGRKYNREVWHYGSTV